MPVILSILAIIIAVLISCIRIVPQANAFVVERLGVYHTTWEAGLHLKLPIIDRVSRRVSLKEQVIDFKPQGVITRDNVTMMIDTVVFFQIFNSKDYSYGVERPLTAIENLTATTLRNIIGELDLDSTLTSRDIINSQITQSLDSATDKWGIKVNRVEVKDITPPQSIREAMEKQMKAERERREKILIAEGEKKSAVLLAEAEKDSTILRAEAEKEKAILLAEAEKEKKIREALGEAEAIRVVQEAEARSIQMLNEANASKEVLTLKSLEALTKVANGNATKIIIPSEIQNLTGLVASVSELTKNDKIADNPYIQEYNSYK